MGEVLAARYWCHMCSQVVNPAMEVEIQCPFCESGFVEEMGSRSDEDTDLGTDQALSRWARILLGMLGTSSRRRRSRREEEVEEQEEEEDEDEQEEEVEPWREESELERDLELIQRRRRRSSAAILQLLQGLPLPTGIISESENSETERERAREHVILINPFNQTITLQDGSSLDLNQNQSSPPGSLGNYLIGPGLEILLQHLVENDPNRYGTPPTEKDAIEAMPNVIIRENLQCSVCLDDFEVGTEAKEMPCKHKFHSGCILPWLELHSSCPVCRFQMPTSDGSKADEDGSGNSTTV